MLVPGDIFYIGAEKYITIEVRSRNDWASAGLEPAGIHLFGVGVLAWCLDAAGNSAIDVSKKQYVYGMDITSEDMA
jgi:hypothetical protein